ncbi:DUF2059 domain-containing protein, partial [Methylobacterium sp. WL116]
MPVLSRRLFPVLVAALVAAAPGLAQAQKAAPQKPAATPAAPA